MSSTVKENDVLCSATHTYKVLKVIGSGYYGDVAQCQTKETKEKVAVKLFKNPDYFKLARNEVNASKHISLKPHPNFIKFIEDFKVNERPCLVFELLHMDLLEFTKHHETCIANLQAVRPIAQQLFAALDFLSTIGVAHTDIKPNNIMFASDETMRIKLIDFGMAFPISKLPQGCKLQNVGYRAPEVDLGLPITQAIDVWSVGCVLFFVFTGTHIFHLKCRYQKMKYLVQLLGQPEDHLLQAGIYTNQFFSQVDKADGQAWRLNTPEEYEMFSFAPTVNDVSQRISSLDELTEMFEEESESEYEDVKVFKQLIEQLLCVDWIKRITASQALKHPFITMSHLNNHRGDNYMSYSEDLMSVSCTAVVAAETQINHDMEDNKEKDGQNKSSEGRKPGGNPSNEDEKFMSCEDRECHSPVERRHQSKNRKCGPSEDGEQRLFSEGQHGPSEGGESEPSKNLATQVGQRKSLADGEQGRCEGRNNESLKQVEQEPSKNGKNKSSRHIGRGDHQPSVDAGQPSQIRKHELDEEQMSSEKGQHDPSKSGDSESSEGLHSGAGERKIGSSKLVQKQVSAEVVPKKMKHKKILSRICRLWLPIKAKFY